MNSTLAHWNAKMAILQAEEMALREKIRAISQQKNKEKLDMGEEDGGGRDQVSNSGLVQAERKDDGWSEDEFDDAVSGFDMEGSKSVQPLSELNPSTGKPYRYLPAELIIQITSYVAHGACSQQTLATCCRISRQWHEAAVPLLYRSPQLYGRNFEPFVHAICPSINPHVRKSPLAELVRVLDMSQLVHQGSKSITARLLGRTKERLEEFVAPQASFSLHSFPALAKCGKLRLLDMSLVSESPPLPDLFKSISNINTLTTLRLPRSTGFGVHHKKSSFTCWPPSLTDLTLSGGIDAHFLHGVASFPQTLTHLTIEHCPMAKTHAIKHLLKTAIRPLERLESVKIAYMPRLSDHALDEILFTLPQISHLSISVDYITSAIFDEGHYHHDHPKFDTIASPSLSHSNTNLRTLELTNSGALDASNKIDPMDLMMANEHDGEESLTLPKLRQVRVAQSLGWHLAAVAEQTEALTEALQDGALRDWETRDWLFANMKERQYRQERAWERVSGVWIFEG